MSLKQPLTDIQAEVHMEEWGLIAQEVGFDALAAAVRDVMRNDSDWFPSVKAIRDRAGLRQEDREQVESRAAWDWMLNYAAHYWHPDIGTYHNAPKIPPRIGYALRQVGGLHAIFHRSLKTEPFMQKEFMEAYRLAPLAEEMAPQLATVFEGKQLTGVLKRLGAAKEMDRSGSNSGDMTE